MKYNKILLAVMVGTMMLSGCSSQPKQPDTDAAQQPRQAETVKKLSFKELGDIGGCASLYMPGNLAAAAATNSSYEKAQDDTSFYGNSEDAWQSLLDGERDIVFAYEPSEQMAQELKEQNITWKQVGTDALVFLAGGTDVSPALKQQDIVQAYEQKHPTWSGYASAPQTDSHMLFDRLLASGNPAVKGKVMADGNTAACPHTQGTLCYTTYLSFLDHSKPENTALVQVDGVLPGAQTLDAYALRVPYYAACRSDLDVNDADMIFYRWLTSEEGMMWLRQETLTPQTLETMEEPAAEQTDE